MEEEYKKINNFSHYRIYNNGKIYSEFMNAAPDNVITTGGVITDSSKSIEFSENLHELGNNVCKYGFEADGTVKPQLFGISYLQNASVLIV